MHALHFPPMAESYKFPEQLALRLIKDMRKMLDSYVTAAYGSVTPAKKSDVVRELLEAGIAVKLAGFTAAQKKTFERAMGQQ
jgi:hypothetical protein